MLGLTQLNSQWLFSKPASQGKALGMALILLSGNTRPEEIANSPIGSVLEHANALYSEKKFADARREFEQAIESDKGSLPAWRGLAWSHWALGQKAQAYQIWTDLAQAFPNDLPTLLALGKAGEQDNRQAEAANYYGQVLGLDPSNQDAHQGRARLLVGQHQFALAEQDLTAILETAPADPAALSLLADALLGQGRYAQAESVLRTLAPVPANLRRLGRALAATGNYRQAADAYKSSLGGSADIGTLNAWRGLGDSLRKAGQNQQAYTLWQGILQAFPNDLPTFLALGKASEQDGLWQQGLDYYTQALQKAPQEQAARFGRARLFSAQQNYPAAESEIRPILAQAPMDAKAGFAMAEILVAQHRDEEAARLLQPLVERDPSPKNLCRLGTILADLGKDTESASYFQQSLQLAPEDDKAVIGLAHTYWNRHAYNESIALLQGYLVRHGDNEAVRTLLAENASAASNWELAERELRTLAALHPDDSKWQLRLASVLHRAGHHGEAVKIAHDVLAKEPDKIPAISLIADDAVFSGDIGAAVFWAAKLAAIEPTSERLSRVAKLRIELGEGNDTQGKHEAAMSQYRAALHDLEQAAALDPVKSMAPVDMLRVLRLQGQLAEAAKLGEQLYAKYPNSVDVIKQLALIYKDQGDYSAASIMLEHSRPFFPNSSSLQENLAELAYAKGDKDQAFTMLNGLIASPSQTIPVLLYHGITASDRQDTVPLQNFKDQLLALKRAGYQAITITQLRSFFDGQSLLPAKPILITFDDARSDSFQYADPVLVATGFQATMFVPVGDVAAHQPYAAVWPTVRKMFATGRWDMQCHGANAQHYVAVNAQGGKGHFLANRMWLADAARLETDQEYAARIERDLLTCKETISREVPGVNIFAFAFPYGDQGHRSLSNATEAFGINQGLIKKHFSLAFNVDNTYLVSGTTSRFTLPRFEVPRTFSGQDLVRQLQAINPERSASYKLAHLDVESGHYAQALTIYDKLADQGAGDNAELLLASGKVLNWSGDHAAARERLTQASALRLNDTAIQKEIAVLDRRLKPTLQLSGLYFNDNAHRSYYSFSPAINYPISDALALSVSYKYLNFYQKLTPPSAGAATGEEHFQADGNQFEGQLNYELGRRSSIEVSAGAMYFSGHASSEPSKSAPTFPLAAAKLNAGIGDSLDLSIAVDHTFVNTAGAILNNIAFTRILGGATIKLSDPLSLSISHAYFDYTNNNQRNRTEVELDSKVWDDPNVTVGAQFIHDDTAHTSRLFWAPQNYMAFAVPVNFKKKWGQSVVATLAVEPGMGKEAGNEFKFQINSTGMLSWNLNDDLSLNLSANRYQAATYANFSAFVGFAMKF
ncbi:tetratricopeptide repeat protein [Methylovulum psychrotolerans]|uniref:Poly-beta-1,6-N-acetyl-D-glucosamine N-deacetylase n=1 Tax=Methylovulum psychrotolerans TaxID=1704499 RepID=A0A2S5CGD0_9GAMM|nr:tetratricopeptide repeat protein [Methylovulum psychrotolerans]POZ49856.1 Poly-beta-1,6-N-acetyl-D-glucosamine N-deacetylase [Methylovulum psychrotolerans]